MAETENKEDPVLLEKKQRWSEEQLDLKKKIIAADCFNWQRDEDFQGLKYIGGIDISFVKGDAVNAFVGYVVLSFPDLEVVYEDCQPVELSEVYIPGFLAFREIEHCLSCIRIQIRKNSALTPDVIFLDGNGLLHPRGCGLACHLGVTLDIATIGCAKNLFQMDNILRDDEHKAKIMSLKKAGDYFELKNTDSEVLGATLRTSDKASTPMYVSIGHKISLDTACALVTRCSKYREPEPTRYADKMSRAVIRRLYPESAAPKKQNSDDED